MWCAPRYTHQIIIIRKLREHFFLFGGKELQKNHMERVVHTKNSKIHNTNACVRHAHQVSSLEYQHGAQ